jgi:hypothetical protein
MMMSVAENICHQEALPLYKLEQQDVQAMMLIFA